jgi:hypothetical protein
MMCNPQKKQTKQTLANMKVGISKSINVNVNPKHIAISYSKTWATATA